MARTPKMSPAALVRAECANLDPDNLCVMRFDGYGDCLVLKGKRCAYFERCVLPLADQPSSKEDRHLQQKRQAGRTAYQTQCGLRVTRQSTRRCICGEPLEPRKQYCRRCRQEHNRNAARERQRRKRADVALSRF